MHLITLALYIERDYVRISKLNEHSFINIKKVKNEKNSFSAII